MAKTTPKFLDIPFTDLIIDDTENSRIKYKLHDLKASIVANGQIQPAVVVPDVTDPTKYRLLAGFHRAKAMQELGHETIMVTVSPATKAADKLMIQLAENIIRTSLSTYEASSWMKKIADTGKPQTEIARDLGKSDAFISNHLGLFDLPMTLQDRCKKEDLNLSQIRFLHAYVKKLDDGGLVKVADDIAKMDEDEKNIFKEKLDAKLALHAAGKPARKKGEAKVKATKAEAAAMSTEAAKEAAAETPIKRTRGEVITTLDNVSKKMATATNASVRQKLIGQSEALQWILGDEMTNLG